MKVEEKPTLVLYFMDGCSHCEKNKPVWEEAKKIAESNGIETKEVEKESAPEISSFPTMKYGDKTLEGSQTSAGALLSGLGIKVGGKRRKSLKKRRTAGSRRTLDTRRGRRR